MDHHSASPSSWESLLRAGLEEDGWPWDWTSLGASSELGGKRAGGKRASRAVSARIVAKDDGVWAVSPLVEALISVSFGLSGGLGGGRSGGLDGGRAIAATSSLEDGDSFRSGQVICRWKGSPRSVMALERPFLNLAAYACGIATETHALVAKVRAACPTRPPRVVPTRKTLPGYRDVAIHAVRAGGGFPHRVNLAGGVLIKENHIAAAGGIANAIAGARQTAPHGLKIEVEVRNLGELDQAMKAGAEAVLLDNFSPEEVRRAIARVKERSAGGAAPVIEVSGGIHAGNISLYAQKGVDVISVGALTHSVKAIDLSLLVSKVGK